MSAYIHLFVQQLILYQSILGWQTAVLPQVKTAVRAFPQSAFSSVVVGSPSLHRRFMSVASRLENHHLCFAFFCQQVRFFKLKKIVDHCCYCIKNGPAVYYIGRSCVFMELKESKVMSPPANAKQPLSRYRSDLLPSTYLLASSVQSVTVYRPADYCRYR